MPGLPLMLWKSLYPLPVKLNHNFSHRNPLPTPHVIGKLCVKTVMIALSSQHYRVGPLLTLWNVISLLSQPGLVGLVLEIPRRGHTMSLLPQSWSLAHSKTWSLVQMGLIPIAAYEEQVAAKSDIHNRRREQQQEAADLVKPQLPTSLQRTMTLAQEKGASSWLTALPVTEHGFTLHKSAFLCLRYGWLPSRTSFNCLTVIVAHNSLWSMPYPAPRVASPHYGTTR